MREASQSSCYTSCWISTELIVSRAYTSTCTIRCRKEGFSALKGNQVDVIDYQDRLGTSGSHCETMRTLGTPSP